MKPEQSPPRLAEELHHAVPARIAVTANVARKMAGRAACVGAADLFETENYLSLSREAL